MEKERQLSGIISILKFLSNIFSPMKDAKSYNDYFLF